MPIKKDRQDREKNSTNVLGAKIKNGKMENDTIISTHPITKKRITKV